MNGLMQEFSFTLPRGFVDSAGVVHRQGQMRLATARDELKAKTYPQVRQYPDYLNLVMLSLVITRLGSLTAVSPTELEGLFTQDLAYLKTFYSQLNQQGHPYVAAHCPDCDRTFEVALADAGTPSGEAWATP
ncbi:phage tail assembly protein [cf. Phormidesmis sp. LEGE 11477]|uniref:phage tail assembly protein n=1 Tax=cf. Phormidesmis sp. LEGE 11477 TaxID=1828680 RepID=UPI001880FD31|nr:phage tail assembly protein [cf. Phormidesmis sp. LEGE 11477]MBE9062419.1 phage tail assembly protein [cf. Phormidesmis sp. LEGE 11477]